MQEELNRKIEDYIANMPSLPVSVGKVMEICNNPHVSPADLNHVISLDPVLVGRVLHLVNSAYYSLSQPVTSLVRAIIMLGINTIKNLTLSTAVMCNLPINRELKGMDMEGFWRHSLCVGVAAKLLARQRGIDSTGLEEYFTAGLLHDIGKIPMNAVLSGSYMLTIGAADRDRTPLYRAEDAELGINHCAAGAAIVKAWTLTGPVGVAIIHHHSYAGYAGDYQDILYSVAAANHFASTMEIGFSGDRYPEETTGQLWDYLKVDERGFAEIKKTVNNEIEKAKVFLKI